MAGFARIILSAVLLVVPALGTGKTQDVDFTAAELLSNGMRCEEEHKLGEARRTYHRLVHRYPKSPEAPEALRRTCGILLEQKRLLASYQCLQKLLDRYPNYPNYLEAIEFEFHLAEQLMGGQRNYFMGKIPGFKNRTAAIDAFKNIIDRAPYGECAPKALMNVALLGVKTKELPIAIDALERLIDEYGSSPQASDALFLLAKVYRSSVPGPAYDQRATEMAINYCQEFFILFPDSPLIPDVEILLAEALELRAAGKLSMGNFYYDLRQNARGGRSYYEEVQRVAPKNSVAAEIAVRRMDEIDEGKPGRGTPLDKILGRYKCKSSQRMTLLARSTEDDEVEMEIFHEDF
ncbi:MAG: tetratricopeptide repeat protein [Puniceicoccales bacterium]|nr:tetratricopeptide repeat protein [Puniceicoccales bacterium]